jgi:hypothetical protein
MTMRKMGNRAQSRHQPTKFRPRLTAIQPPATPNMAMTTKTNISGFTYPGIINSPSFIKRFFNLKKR